MSSFDFTAEEVQLNRKGILSARQKNVLKAMAGGMRQSSKSGIWITLFFVLLGLCLMLAVMAKSFDASRWQTLGPQFAVGFCFSIAAVFFIITLGIFFTRRNAAKLEASSVLTAEGAISHDSGYSEATSRYYYVYFGDKRFTFPDDMSRVFPEGAVFRIYYCKAGLVELIMSFERIS